MNISFFQMILSVLVLGVFQYESQDHVYLAASFVVMALYRVETAIREQTAIIDGDEDEEAKNAV